jgi:hypothetical protein
MTVACRFLDIKFTAADAANLGTVLTTLNSAFTRGLDFPNGAYWEVWPDTGHRRRRPR